MLNITNAADLRKRFEAVDAKSVIFPKAVVEAVREIIDDVARNGDEAVWKYSNRFDGTKGAYPLKVSKSELLEYADEADEEIKTALRAAIKNIRAFHQNQLEKGWGITTQNGSFLGNIVTPLEKVGVYVPGGTAAYPSSVIMNIVPAQIAGVKDLAIFTPPTEDGRINKYVAAAAVELGVEKIYRVGGVQAIAAAAFGTETINKVDKITGPGNIYVAAAKREVYGMVDIDMIAGPSEIVIAADETAKAHFVAADMLSQAEHDERAQCILLTDSRKLAQEVIKELDEQLRRLERKEIAEKAILKKGAVCLVDKMQEAIELINIIAPEHLEIVVKSAEELLAGVRNAGAIFVGAYSSEPIGDYIAGPNHVLPTGGTARYFSPLTVRDFQKVSSFIHYSKKDFMEYAPLAIRIAEAEGLTAHANAMKVRLEK